MFLVAADFLVCCYLGGSLIEAESPELIPESGLEQGPVGKLEQLGSDERELV